MYQTDPPRSPKDVLPTMYDLPSEDPEEPGLPDQFHILQPRLLDETFCPPNYPSGLSLDIAWRGTRFRLV
ncbi:hypothetical protein A6770_06975 [Nostoc minutum NIES-26]|uniref:Uma2 family endonuclease n=1 Tax=Nostoc minutum NIES-26 TaxID=1844469 RepID=A0A367Q2D0_9NOSO|nr:hypothetical protein A6770_06975 [Nostoc minutum NIES-26]